MATVLNLPAHADIYEFEVLYTKNKTQKRKEWHDGFLKWHTFNFRSILYDQQRKQIGIGAHIETLQANLEHVYRGGNPNITSPLRASNVSERAARVRTNTPASARGPQSRIYPSRPPQSTHVQVPRAHIEAETPTRSLPAQRMGLSRHRTPKQNARANPARLISLEHGWFAREDRPAHEDAPDSQVVGNSKSLEGRKAKRKRTFDTIPTHTLVPHESIDDAEPVQCIEQEVLSPLREVLPPPTTALHPIITDQYASPKQPSSMAAPAVEEYFDAGTGLFAADLSDVPDQARSKAGLQQSKCYADQPLHNDATGTMGDPIKSLPYQSVVPRAVSSRTQGMVGGRKVETPECIQEDNGSKPEAKYAKIAPSPFDEDGFLVAPPRAKKPTPPVIEAQKRVVRPVERLIEQLPEIDPEASPKPTAAQTQVRLASPAPLFIPESSQESSFDGEAILEQLTTKAALEIAKKSTLVRLAPRRPKESQKEVKGAVKRLAPAKPSSCPKKATLSLTVKKAPKRSLMSATRSQSPVSKHASQASMPDTPSVLETQDLDALFDDKPHEHAPRLATQICQRAPDFMSANSFHAGSILKLDQPIPAIGISARQMEAIDFPTQLTDA
ncbi:hypothetical protein MRB53_039802 [Persea americana]|nr:hypothetical protein MRB53_039802 [Persea americana]